MTRRFAPALLLVAAGVCAGRVGLAGAPDKVTLTGLLSDEICATKHIMVNATAAECGRQCVIHGADYVLVTKDKTYTLKPDNTKALEDLDALITQNVTITGEPEASEDFVWVLTVTAAK